MSHSANGSRTFKNVLVGGVKAEWDVRGMWKRERAM